MADWVGLFHARRKSLGIDVLPTVESIKVDGCTVTVIYPKNKRRQFVVSAKVADYIKKTDAEDVHIGVSDKADWLWVKGEDDSVELIEIPALLTQALLARGASCDF